MKRSLAFVIGVTLVGLLVLLAVVSFFWTPFDPNHIEPAARLLPPSWPHIMGTDHLGIDIFSRILAGARICLLVGMIAVSIGALLGIPLGIIVGSGKGWMSRIIMRATDILYAFPALLLAILLAAANGGGSVVTAMVAIGISSMPAFTRVARAATLQVMSQDFILAARASATPKRTIALQHVLPNIAPVMLVQSSVSFGLAILAEAALSYLGLSAPPTTVTWGRMLFDAQSYLFSEPNLALWPGLFIALAVLGCNLLGDGLREMLDPKLQEVR
jgi:peptide/nickel transport system permease protein